MSSFANKKEALAARLQHRFTNLNKIGEGTPRHSQLLALLMIPFVFVLTFTASVALKDVITSLVPNTGALAPVLFLIGIVLLIASLTVCFIWVKTGGFGIFV